MLTTILICLAVGYFIGCFSTGYLVGKANHIDIREHGSGNAGATNTLRTLGLKAGAITFFGDALKAVIPITIFRLMNPDIEPVWQLYGLYLAVGVTLGHNFPFYLKFKGGKGIASTAGLILAVNPIMFLIVAVVFISIVLITQYVSLASIVIMILFVIMVVVKGQTDMLLLPKGDLYEYYAIAIILALLAIWRHRANIKRLLNGTENKTDVKKIGKKS
mgnify:CR=1 FL=1